jgi:hypothetical protein
MSLAGLQRRPCGSASPTRSGPRREPHVTADRRRSHRARVHLRRRRGRWTSAEGPTRRHNVLATSPARPTPPTDRSSRTSQGLKAVSSVGSGTTGRRSSSSRRFVPTHQEATAPGGNERCRTSRSRSCVLMVWKKVKGVYRSSMKRRASSMAYCSAGVTSPSRFPSRRVDTTLTWSHRAYEA